MKGCKLALTCVVLWLASVSSPVNAGAANKNTNMAGGRHTIVEMFQWRWVDLANECETFLGPYGFGAIQTSPPQENAIVNDPPRPWWEIYQPVSYILETRDGTEAEFKDMVSRCNAVNVRVYVDAVINHMTGDSGSGVGTAGSSWNADASSYPAVPFDASNFHTCPGDCTAADCQIDDYTDASQIRNCELSYLLDLNQANPDTQAQLVAFMNHLVDMGVAGFRMDAAKHMWPEDLDAIYNQLHDLSFAPGSKPYVYQEVSDYRGTDAAHYYEYTDLGDVTEFEYGRQLAPVFRRQNPMKYLSNWGEGWGMMPSDDALVFVDNHDTQRDSDDDVLTFLDARMYKMANAFMLAHPYGQTRVMSSFYFPKTSPGGTDQGPPHDANYNILPVTTNPDLSCDYYNWVCEHRWREIFNMVGFRNTVDGTEMENWWSGSAYSIAFSRGNKGFLAINNEDFDMDANIYTGLPAGTYCDLISGNLLEGVCSGSTVTVDGNGNAQITISSTWDDPMIAFTIDSKLN